MDYHKMPHYITRTSYLFQVAHGLLVATNGQSEAPFVSVITN